MRSASKKGVILFALSCFIGGQAFADSGSLSAHGVNYPHEIGTDYVYRTDHVFAPKERDMSWVDDVKGLFKRKYEPGPLPAVPEELAGELKLKVRELGDQLFVHSREPIAGEYRVVVSTFVNLNRLYMTSGLGRIIAEQMISELQRGGVEVVDVRMTPALQLSEGHGEYSLSRDMSELSYVHEAQAVVAGTYTVSDGQVVVGARLLQQGDGLVLSSGSIVIPVNNYVRGLLEDEAMPSRRGSSVQLRNFSEIDSLK